MIQTKKKHRSARTILRLPAIAEAVERKNMRFVPIKTDDQLDLQGDPPKCATDLSHGARQ